MEETWKIALISAALISALTAPLSALAAQEKGCAEEFDQLEFSAKYSWSGAPEPMRVRVGRASRGEKGSEWIAQLSTESKGCFAFCSVKNFERENPLTPVALNLQCQSGQFGPLSAPTTILWNKSGKAEIIRFGTWIAGYEQTTLSVDMDTYSGPSLAPRTLAQSPR
ncbi:MAG: hypothetical protein ACXWPM_03890 [Bdellovibrionota bacterium]